MVRDHDLFTEGVVSDSPCCMDDLVLVNGEYRNSGLLQRTRYFADVVPNTAPPQIRWSESGGTGVLFGRLIHDFDTLKCGELKI